MVDYLCRCGVVVPTGQPERGRGRHRRYTFGDVVVLRAASHLLRCGVEVKKLRPAFEALRARHRDITMTSLPGKYLVATDRRIYFRTDRADVLEELDGQRAFGFVIKLATVRSEVTRTLAGGRAPARASGQPVRPRARRA